MQYLVYILTLFGVINLYFKLAVRFNIIDKPCERSSHNIPIIRGGGIIFPIGLLFWFMVTGFQYPWFFAGLILISLVSFLDDLKQIAFWKRLLIQIAAIILLLIQFELDPGPWWFWSFAIFAGIGIVNAFNFMDGINGMTTGYSFSVLLGLWIVNNYQVSFVDNELLYSVGGGIIVFGFYNFRSQARCFAGDVGSVSISFILLFLLLRLLFTSGNLFYSMFLVVYGVDTFLTIFYRLIHRENIFNPHRKHLYQLLANEYKISHLIVSTCYTFIQLIINFSVILAFNRLSFFYTLILSMSIVIILFGCYHAVKSKIEG